MPQALPMVSEYGELSCMRDNSVSSVMTELQVGLILAPSGFCGSCPGLGLWIYGWL